jgi:hypothetical protein
LHERLVEAVEGLGDAVSLLAQLVRERHDLLEVDVAVPQLGAKLADEILELARQLLGVFQ